VSVDTCVPLAVDFSDRYSSVMTLMPLNCTRCLALVSTAFMLLFLTASCGVGVVGPAGAAASGDSDSSAPPVRSELRLGASVPALSSSLAALSGTDPAASDTTIRLAFTEPLRSSFNASSFSVEARRFAPSGPTWNQIEVRSASLENARTVVLALESGTWLGSAHRLSMSDLVADGSGIAVPDATVYFSVRSGEWGELQLVGFGEGIGSISLSESFARYSPLGFLSSAPGGFLFDTTLLTAAPLLGWGSPERFYSRLAVGFGEERIRPQPGRLLINDDIGLVRINESCLLYTSPSPRDRTRSRMPSSA